jgi:CubicO group peptidase (beta-lactamase class C family)
MIGLEPPATDLRDCKIPPHTLGCVAMKTLPRLFFAALAAFMQTPAAAEHPVLPEIRAAMEARIAAGEIAGAVTVVGDEQRILHFDAVGSADLEADAKLQGDALFWVASMTKPITATALMMLAETGALCLDDDVSGHLPEFSGLKDADGKAVVVTIRQCLSHTSGLAEVSMEETREVTDLADLTPLIAAKPVQFAPGSKWQYSQSSINTAARIVEVVSGMSFADFLDRRIFSLLGMNDTTFYLSEEQAARVASSYARTAAGTLEKTPLGFLDGKSPVSKDRYPRANGGLFSTADDFARFSQMLLRGGELDGVRILMPESIAEMTSVQTGDLATGFTPGNSWGVGWCVVREPQGVSEALSPDSFGHGGAYGTQWWIDPTKSRYYLLLVQRANFPNSDASEVRKNFQNAASAALDGE